MDPLSFIANVITLFEFSVKLQDLLSRWKDAPESLRNLEQSVGDMRTVLRLVTNKSEAASAASADQEYIETIGKIAEKCSKVVRELYEILLPLDKSTSSLERIRHRLSSMLKERDIKDKMNQIQDYTSKLDLLLSSLTSKKATRIEATLDEINRKLDDFLTLPSYTSPIEDSTTPQEELDSADRFEFLLIDAIHSEEGHRRPSFLDGIEDVELRELKEEVRTLQSKRMYHKAAQIQHRIIEIARSQIDGEGQDDICDLQEQHADLLLECSTPARLQEATTILSDALQRQKERAPSKASLHQQGRLMSKLAKLYRDGDGLGETHKPGKSKSFFTNSIIYLYHAKTFLPTDFLTVGEAMVHFSEANSEPARARDIKKRILDTLKQRAPDFEYNWDEFKIVQDQTVLDWCREQGFSADQLQFRFDAVQASNHGNTSPLHLAIHEGKKEMVEKMLVEVDDVNLPDRSGMTPLLLAARKRQSEIAQVLLAYGASTEARTRDEKTALHLCLEEDSKRGVKVTQCLLDGHPELIDLLDQEGKTALHLAVLKGHQSIASLLLERNANPDIQEENGKTPLLMAVESRIPESARGQNNISRVSTTVTTSSMTSSTTSGSRRSSQNSQRPGTGSTPRRNSRGTIIALLLEHGANPTIADHTDNLPLHSACKQDDIETVKLLLENWTQPGRSLVNQPGPMKATPIIIAVKGQHVAIVRELVRWGANANQRDRAGHSAEDYARKPGARKHELIEALRDAGV
ncbi:hypothetical protein E8E14_006883 [Neopestalotiopsis sp. 37M]|nr:hypothetical protein E8E14_006883 [Neopestalotiopsis sp. 37M]